MTAMQKLKAVFIKRPERPCYTCRGIRLLAFCMFLALLFSSGCATTASKRPQNIADACSIFEERDSWYESARKSADRWGVPIHVQLAIIRQESGFNYDARPPRGRFLWVIPWFRESSAYGFAQAKDPTWEWYVKKTGRWWADRDDFDDAIDFVGWYCKQSHDRLKISNWDAYNQYLAYHEGHGGYERKTFNDKKWLIETARRVEKNAAEYRAQIAKCRGKFDKGLRLWPF